MADVKLRIEVNSDAETEMLGKVSLNDESKNSNTGIKTTNKVYQTIPSAQISGVEGLSFGKGYLVFNKEGYLANEDSQSGTLQSEQNPVEFVWGATDNDGNYDLTLKFSNCQSLDKIVIYGDKISNQFPIQAYLDNETEPIESDDSKWAIMFKSPASSHTIRFTKWNRSNYNAVITLIRVMLKYIDIDKFSGLKMVESWSQSTGQPRTISYGVVPNTGSAEMVDVNGELYDLINDGIIPNSNLKVQLLANGRQVQEHSSVDSDYNNISKIFSIELGDELSKWDKLQYAGYSYPNESRSAYEMLCHVFKSIGYNTTQIDNMLSEQIIFGTQNETGSVKDYLLRIIVEYPFLEKATIRATIEKFCVLAQLQVYRKDNGNVVFVSSRPIATSNEFNNAVYVPKKSQSQPFSKSIVLKNKYQAVDMLVKKVDDAVDYNAIVGSVKDSVLKDKETNTHNAIKTDTYQKTGTRGGGSEPLKYWTSAAYGYVKTIYTSGTIVIPKLSNSNLHQVLDVYTGTDGEQNYIKHSVTYEKKTGPASRFYSPTGSGWGALVTSITETTTGSSIISKAVSTSNWLTISLPDDTNLSTISYTTNSNGDYVLNYTVLIGKETITTSGTYERDYMYGEYSPDLTTTGTIEIYEPQKLEISFYGDKRVISFDDISASDSNVNEVSTFASVDVNELIQQNTSFDGVKISEIIKSNIKNDYKNGVSNGTLKIPCVDFYTKTNNLRKSWVNGEMIETHDLLSIEGDKGTWRVTGRKFRKSGVPLVDLEVQEIHNKI